MRIRSACAALLLAVAVPAALAGSVYKWTDAQGHVHYGDSPAQGAQKLDMDPNGGQAAAASGEQANAAQKAAECTRQRDQLTTYRSATTIVEKDALGKEREYSGEERQKLIELTQSKMDAACAGQPPADSTAAATSAQTPR